MSTIDLKSVTNETNFSKISTSQQTYKFMMIEEKDFPELYSNRIVKGQKMTDFYDEIDYASDEEIINSNR